MGQAIGHADAGQAIKCVGVIGPLWVDHRQGRGHDWANGVVIRDDHIQAQLDGPLHLCHAADAAIHGDEDMGTSGGDGLHGFQVEAVTLVHPVGDVGADPSPGGLDGGDQQGGGGDAVGVEVAVDADGLTAVNRLEQPLHRLGQPFEPIGVLFDCVISGQKTPPFGLNRTPRFIEHLGQDRVLRSCAQV